MRVQPYGNSDGSDKGDYHRKWEAAINSKKKKQNIWTHYPSWDVYRPLCPTQTPHGCRVLLFISHSCEIQSDICILISHRKCTQTQNLYEFHIQQCSSHGERPGLKVCVWTLCGSLASCRGGGGERGWSSSVYLSPTPPTPLPSLPPLATWHTLWLICQCAGIIGAGHAWCVRDRMSR